MEHIYTDRPLGRGLTHSPINMVLGLGVCKSDNLKRLV